MADTKFMNFAEAAPGLSDSVLVANAANGVRRATLENLRDAIGSPFRRITGKSVSGAADWNDLTEATVYSIEDCDMSEKNHAPKDEYNWGIRDVIRREPGKDTYSMLVQTYYPHRKIKSPGSEKAFPPGIWIRMQIGLEWTGWTFVRNAAITDEEFTKIYAAIAGLEQRVKALEGR